MPRLLAFVPMVGTGGNSDPFRPSGIRADLSLPGGGVWSATDPRRDPTKAGTYIVLDAEMTVMDRAALLLTAGVTELTPQSAAGACAARGLNVDLSRAVTVDDVAQEVKRAAAEAARPALASLALRN